MVGNEAMGSAARVELGARVRRARERGPRALKLGVISQEAAGPQIGRSRRWWQKLEAGQADPSLCDLEAIAELLWVDLPYLLGLTAGKIASEESVDRRAFVAGVAAVSAVGIDLERLAYPSVDAAYLAGAEALTESLMGQWYTLPPAAMLPAANGHLGALKQLLPGPSSLLSVTGRTAAMVGHCLVKLERRNEAYLAYALAESAARDAGDEALRALVLASHSTLYSTVAHGPRSGDLPTALSLLDAAAISAASAPGRLRAVVHARRAEERAVTGDAAGATRDLETAEAALANPGDGYHFGPRTPAELGAFRGNVELLLGRHADAQATLETTLATMDPRLISWRAAVLADQGAAFARSGEVDAAVDRLERALQLAKTAGDHLSRVAGIRQRDLEPWADEPAVARLDEQLGA